MYRNEKHVTFMQPISKLKHSCDRDERIDVCREKIGKMHVHKKYEANQDH